MYQQENGGYKLPETRFENRGMDEHNLEESFMVPCMELCQLTVKSLPSSHVPPASDWACYDTSTGIHCDIDVSNDAYEGITFETYTNKGGSKYGERPVSLNTSQLDRNVYFRPDLVYVDPDAADMTHVPDEAGMPQRIQHPERAHVG